MIAAKLLPGLAQVFYQPISKFYVINRYDTLLDASELNKKLHNLTYSC